MRKPDFAAMSDEDLWELYEEISKLLEAKILTEKKVLESRLKSLRQHEDEDPDQ